MIIIFKSNDEKITFTAKTEDDIEEIYWKIEAGLKAMTYADSTAKEFVEELKEGMEE